MAITATFIGGPECGNVGETTWEDTITKHKVVFPINVPVVIDADNEPVVARRALLRNIEARVRGNRFFVVEESAKALLKANAPSFETAPADEVDDEKAELIREAESLGIDVDRRWGVERLGREISAAKIARI